MAPARWAGVLYAGPGTVIKPQFDFLHHVGFRVTRSHLQAYSYTSLVFNWDQTPLMGFYGEKLIEAAWDCIYSNALAFSLVFKLTEEDLRVIV